MALDRAYLGPDGVIPDGLSTSLGRTKGFLFGEGHVEESLPQCPLNSVTSIRSGSRRVEVGQIICPFRLVRRVRICVI